MNIELKINTLIHADKSPYIIVIIIMNFYEQE